MHIKQNFLPCFLSVVVIVNVIFISSAFADLKMVEESELARTNVSITGTTVTTGETPAEAKHATDFDNLSTERANEASLDKTKLLLSPSVNKVIEWRSESFSIGGREMFNSSSGGGTMNSTGGTSITTR